MHITCPHCNATYEVGPVIKNALLVCFRCHTEFSVNEPSFTSENDSDERDAEQNRSLPLFEHIDNSSPKNKNRDKSAERASAEADEIDVAEEDVEEALDSSESSPDIEKSEERLDIELTEIENEPPAESSADEKSNGQVDLPEQAVSEEPPQSEPAASELEKPQEGPAVADEKDDTVPEPENNEPKPLAPARSRAAIWPWLIIILLIIGGSGFWIKKDLWLDNPWVRSVLINMHMAVEVRDRDWNIIPESVHGQWLTRDDQSRILMIEGRVANRLYCELSPPQIQVHFFDDSGLDQVLGEITLPITEPPAIEQLKHAPFERPVIDQVPVEAQGERGFFLVLDSLPKETADFTLTAVVKKR